MSLILKVPNLIIGSHIVREVFEIGPQDPATETKDANKRNHASKSQDSWVIIFSHNLG